MVCIWDFEIGGKVRVLLDSCYKRFELVSIVVEIYNKKKDNYKGGERNLIRKVIGVKEVFFFFYLELFFCIFL